ncbi:hypothetical protein EZS27_038094 [termite gut metagenome]|uniref:Uncharacterized protein n=1 Tax=termite gut metagenome TaxID=433724 RepID=A0A5J4PMD3_9ZZZZ
MNKGTVFTDEIESNHGRIETHQCSILPVKDYLLEENLQAWKQVATLIKIQASREIKGVLHQQTRYYISDEEVPQPACLQFSSKRTLGDRKSLALAFGCYF